MFNRQVFLHLNALSEVVTIENTIDLDLMR
jgi:hypothetical protein